MQHTYTLILASRLYPISTLLILLNQGKNLSERKKTFSPIQTSLTTKLFFQQLWEKNICEPSSLMERINNTAVYVILKNGQRFVFWKGEGGDWVGKYGRKKGWGMRYDVLESVYNFQNIRRMLISSTIEKYVCLRQRDGEGKERDIEKET